MSLFDDASTAICSTRGVGGMVHFARKTDRTGIELRTRFWFPPNMPEMMLIGLTAHNIMEYGRLAVFAAVDLCRRKREVTVTYKTQSQRLL